MCGASAADVSLCDSAAVVSLCVSDAVVSLCVSAADVSLCVSAADVSLCVSGPVCNRTFDQYVCWPDGSPGTTVNVSCPWYLPWYQKGKPLKKTKLKKVKFIQFSVQMKCMLMLN